MRASPPSSPTSIEATPQLLSTKAPFTPCELEGGLGGARKRVRMSSPVDAPSEPNQSISHSDDMERAAKILCGNGDFVPLQQPPARTTAMSEAIGHAAVLLGITRFDGPRQGSHLGWTPAELSTALDLGAERPAVFGSRRASDAARSPNIGASAHPLTARRRAFGTAGAEGRRSRGRRPPAAGAGSGARPPAPPSRRGRGEAAEGVGDFARGTAFNGRTHPPMGLRAWYCVQCLPAAYVAGPRAGRARGGSTAPAAAGRTDSGMARCGRGRGEAIVRATQACAALGHEGLCRTGGCAGSLS
eukprot:6715121-Prymnesium_polylepis.1